MFLNSFAFWGTAGAIGVSVPIIIHLLNRRKFERVVWAAMRFIQQAIQQNQRRIKVEDLILLIIRCLIIALIALALARPITQSNFPSLGQSTSTVIVLDCSGSMSAGAENLKDLKNSRFEQAKKIADQIVSELPAKSEVTLLLVNDSLPEVIPQPSINHQAVRGEIAQAQLTDRGSNIVPAIKKSFEILATRNTLRKELITITDGQRLAWKQTGEIQKLLEENKKNIHSTLLFVGEMPKKNLAITDLRLDSEIPVVGRELRFTAQVTNFSPVAYESAISLRIDNDVNTKYKVAIPEIKPGEPQSVILTAKFDKDGFHTVTAVLPDDPMPSGNERSVVFHVIKSVNVLIVDGDPQPEPRDSKAFYLSNLLRTESYIYSQTLSASEFASQHEFDKYDVILLANVSDLPVGILPGFKKFVERGGGLAVFPGANANVSFYNDQLFRAFNLIPASLGEPRGDSDQEMKFLTFMPNDFAHPIVSMWTDPQRGNPLTARFFRTWNLNPAKERPKSNSLVGEPRIVIRYNDGTPAIIERPMGSGRTVLFSSGADTKWNDLPVASQGKVFVPLIMHTIGSFIGREDELYNIRAGERLAIPQPSDRLGQDVTVSLVGDDKFARSSSKIEISGGIPMLKIDKSDRAGVYNAEIGTENIKFAVAPNAEESAIEALPAQQIKDFKSETVGATVIEWKPGAQLTDILKRAQTGSELWLYFAIPALILAALETFLAHVFSKPK